MALTSYSDLLAATADYLNRGDLTARIPDFVVLVDMKIRRRLRQRTVRAQLSLPAGDADVALPSECLELRSLWLTSGQPHRDVPLKIVTPETLAEFRAMHAGVSGRPKFAAVVNNELLLVPTPDQAYTANLIYYQELVPLAENTSPATLLAEMGDAYLYGTLAEAEPYLQNDERMPMWKQRFDEALAELELFRDRQEYGASLRPARFGRVFG